MLAYAYYPSTEELKQQDPKLEASLCYRYRDPVSQKKKEKDGMEVGMVNAELYKLKEFAF